MNSLVKSVLASNNLDFVPDFVLRNNPIVWQPSSNYPPYNAWFEGDDCYIEMAVAGFDSSQIVIDFDGNVLNIKGFSDKLKEEKTDTDTESKDKKDRIYIHRGLSKRDFVKRFELKSRSKLDFASLKNGILLIKLNLDSYRETVQIQIE